MTGVLRNLDEYLKRLELGDRFVRRNPLYYGSIRRQIDSLQECTLAQRMLWTETRLSSTLAAARRTRYGQGVGDARQLKDWPLLQKDRVRENPTAFHSRAWFSARASTGGTTGTPVELVRSPAAIVAEQVCLDRMIRALDCDPRTARIAVLRADRVKEASDDRPPFWSYVVGGRRLILSSAHLSAGTLPSFLSELRKFRPDVLWVHPTMLEVLCRLLARSGEALRIPGVLASSEVLATEVWKLARELIGCAIVDYYGLAERVAFAHASHPDQYFFLPGYAAIELLPHTSEGDEGWYEIVGTSLWNTAMPLVRYCTGDLIRTPTRCSERELQEIAHGIRSFSGVIGRSQDVLLSPNGDGVTPGVSHIAHGVEHLLRLQILQRAADHIVLRVLAGPQFSATDADRLMRNAQKKVAPPARIDIEIVDSLERTARGKTPLVIHSPAVLQALRAAGLEVRRR
jgi:phenylacetate-coenzyme A ligase PaaK-like adenylate-forming protein